VYPNNDGFAPLIIHAHEREDAQIIERTFNPRFMCDQETLMMVEYRNSEMYI
jgi:hypothetical protein